MYLSSPKASSAEMGPWTHSPSAGGRSAVGSLAMPTATPGIACTVAGDTGMPHTGGPARKVSRASHS